MREYEIHVYAENGKPEAYSHEMHLRDQSAIQAGKRLAKGRPFRIYSDEGCVAFRAPGQDTIATGQAWDGLSAKVRSSKSLAALRTTIDTLPMAFMIFDNCGDMVSHDGAMERLVGKCMPSKDRRQISAWKFCDHDGAEIAPQNWPSQCALRGETLIRGFAATHRGPLHGERSLHVTAMPIKDGEVITGCATLIQDVEWSEREGARDMFEQRFVEAVFDTLNRAIPRSRIIAAAAS